ncbi:MAG TPA: hypothetical protein VFR84_08855 [Candidatus Angelobacter sp.]|nr:hypothetical protein [Candidatus Angelobacter sp.]
MENTTGGVGRHADIIAEIAMARPILLAIVLLIILVLARRTLRR